MVRIRLVKRNVAISVTVLLLLLLVTTLAWTETPTSVPTSVTTDFLPKSLRVGGGSLGGSTYVAASTFTKLLEREWRIPVTTEVTAGATENIRLVDRGEIQVGIGNDVIIWQALDAVRPFEQKITTIRVLAYLYPNPNHFFTTERSGITTFKELKGKRVGVGVSKAWDQWVRPILSSQGLEYDKDIEPVYAGLGDLYTMVGDGRIAAANHPMSGTVPLSSVLQAGASHKLVYLPYDEEALKSMVAEHPELRLAISKVSRKYVNEVFGLDRDFLAISPGIQCFFSTDNMMSDEVAYNFVKLLHLNLEALAQESAYFQYAVNNKDTLTLQTGLEYHTGAIKYWKEVGLWPK